MKTTNAIVACAMSMGLGMALVGGYAVAKGGIDVRSKTHPNLASAHKLADQAHTKLLDAQKANEWDLGGHAEKAKKLLEEVDKEITAAFEAAK